jgi:AGZA family xanthine/uracil permease-like MFS transporter
MAYILFVQPLILSGMMFGKPTGMDFNAIITSTCLAAAIATLVMGLWARYPIALAPGMGENFFFVLSIIPAAASSGCGEPWRVALGAVLISAVLFFIVYLLGIRQQLFDALTPSIKNAIATGIGFFIAFIGLQNASIIIKASGTAVALTPHFTSPDIIVFLVGLLFTAGLQGRRVRGAILVGILFSALFALLLRGMFYYFPDFFNSPSIQKSLLMDSKYFHISKNIISLPASPAPLFFKADVIGALNLTILPFIIVLLFMDVFDTIGTLVGVGEQAGLVKHNKLPRARQAMLADQLGTLIGAGFGNSTVTSYIESAAGVEVGGRTGLTAVIVAVCFLLATFFTPLIAMIGKYPPITAPALVIVGALMMRNVNKIKWDDYTEGIPAFLMIIGIPLSYSIADGLALGFILYPIIKFFSGRYRECSLILYIMAIVLLFYMLFVRSQLAP